MGHDEEENKTFSAADELNRIVEAEQKENIEAAGGDIILAPAEKAPKDKKVIIIIVLLIAVVIVFAIGFLMKGGGLGSLFGGSNNNDSAAKKSALEKGIGAPNLDAIFDSEGFIPYQAKDGRYGYLDQGGSEIIEAKYISASDFYGGYAAVTYLEDNALKSAVIDKEGNVKVSGEDSAEYDIENNIWLVDSNIYTFNFEKLNDDNTNAYYLGGGYIKNAPREIRNEKDAPSAVIEGIPYITNTDKKKVYSCKAECYIAADEYGKYAVISEGNENSKIIKLENGSTVYTAGAKDSLTFFKGSTFEEKTGDSAKYVTIENDKSSVSDDYNVEEKESISNQKEFYVNECDGGNFSVKKGNDEIVGCELSSVTSLSKNTYLKLKKDNKPAAILAFDEKTVLYNLNDKNNIYEFKTNEYLIAPDNSPFVGGIGDNYITVYNILNLNTVAFNGLDKNSVSNIEYHNNYLKLVVNNKEKIYNSSLSEVR